jgi:T-complex protein 1 subunit beta
VLVNISKVQDDEVGDGTTSVCVLAAELLREAEHLINQHIHPQTIIEGYRLASAAAYKTLEASAVDHSLDKELFREDLINIAKTTLSSKVLSQDKEYFSKLAVDAVLRLKGSTNLENIQIIKKPGGKLMDSYLDEGELYIYLKLLSFTDHSLYIKVLFWIKRLVSTVPSVLKTPTF